MNVFHILYSLYSTYKVKKLIVPQYDILSWKFLNKNYHTQAVSGEIIYEWREPLEYYKHWQRWIPNETSVQFKVRVQSGEVHT